LSKKKEGEKGGKINSKTFKKKGRKKKRGEIRGGKGTPCLKEGGGSCVSGGDSKKVKMKPFVRGVERKGTRYKGARKKSPLKKKVGPPGNSNTGHFGSKIRKKRGKRRDQHVKMGEPRESGVDTRKEEGGGKINPNGGPKKKG